MIRQKVNTNLNVEVETVENIEKLMLLTHRAKGDVIDWLVAEEMERIAQRAETPQVEEPAPEIREEV